MLGSSIVKVVTEESEWDVVVASRKFIADAEGYQRWNANGRSDWKELIVQERWKPDVIINTAALTDVDKCEVEREEAWRSNVELVTLITEVARKIDARVIQISTDYVFDGKEGPYTETDRPQPINYYGKTKLAAENICLSSGVDYTIVRTMWLYGESMAGKRTFVDWITEGVRRGDSLKIAGDEIGNPTLIDDIGYAILKVIERNIGGIINICGDERISRWEWAKNICSVFNKGSDKHLVEMRSTDLGRKALRPLNSGLVMTKANTLLDFKPVSVMQGLELVRIQKERIER